MKTKTKRLLAKGYIALMGLAIILVNFKAGGLKQVAALVVAALVIGLFVWSVFLFGEEVGEREFHKNNSKESNHG